jgi:hypothetical protein
MKCCNHKVIKQSCQCHNCSGYLCELGKQYLITKEARMKCPKCDREMNTGYEDILNYGLSKPIWFCPDWKNCKYTMLRKKAT